MIFTFTQKVFIFIRFNRKIYVFRTDFFKGNCVKSFPQCRTILNFMIRLCVNSLAPSTSAFVMKNNNKKKNILKILSVSSFCPPFFLRKRCVDRRRPA